MEGFPRCSEMHGTFLPQTEKMGEGWEGGVPGSLPIKLEEPQDMASWCVCTQAGQGGGGSSSALAAHSVTHSLCTHCVSVLWGKSQGDLQEDRLLLGTLSFGDPVEMAGHQES